MNGHGDRSIKMSTVSLKSVRTSSKTVRSQRVIDRLHAVQHVNIEPQTRMAPHLSHHHHRQHHHHCAGIGRAPAGSAPRSQRPQRRAACRDQAATPSRSAPCLVTAKGTVRHRRLLTSSLVKLVVVQRHSKASKGALRNQEHRTEQSRLDKLVIKFSSRRLGISGLGCVWMCVSIARTHSGQSRAHKAA